ncbi:MAG: contractile injection system tape measure protein [Ginsengibacter sp.]
MSTTTHIIQKQTLQVTFPDRYKAALFQEKIKRSYYEKILPQFDNLFSELVRDDLIVRLDKVDLDLGHLRGDDLEKQLIEKIIPVMRNELQSRLMFEVKDSRNIHLISPGQSAINAFLYFLKSGYFPWWCAIKDLSVLESEVTMNYAIDKDLPAALLSLIKINPHSRARLNSQFSEQFKYFLVEKVCPSMAMKEELANKLFLVYDKARDVILRRTDDAGNQQTERVNKKNNSSINEEINSETKSNFQKIEEPGNLERTEQSKKIIQSPSSSNNDDITQNTKEADSGENIEKDRAFYEKTSETDNTDQTLQNRASAREQLKEKDFDGESIYLDLAGLVILHPFIAPFFAAFGLTIEHKFISKEAAHDAVHLLGYMASSETALQEQILLLPKLLCGIEFNESINKEIIITPEQEKEVTELLSAVISYWGALKNTSPDGLRNMFLKRAGKLSPREGGWQLDVEQKTWDILMGKLPWGISVVKLPWMKQILFVNWQ